MISNILGFARLQRADGASIFIILRLRAEIGSSDVVKSHQITTFSGFFAQSTFFYCLAQRGVKAKMGSRCGGREPIFVRPFTIMVNS